MAQHLAPAPQRAETAARAQHGGHLPAQDEPERPAHTDALGNSTRAPRAPRRAVVSFNDLPIETLVDIFALLSPAELKDLRLVCRRWNYAALDKAVWTHAFRNRFGTGDSFASVTRLPTWLAEYFGRVARTRQWAKARARTHLYLLVNSQYGAVEFVEADFGHDRLMTFSRVLGSLALCALVLGKNQVFIPENLLFTRVSAYDASWTHLAVGTGDGAVYVKNLVTATAAALSQLLVVALAGARAPVVQVRVRRAGALPSMPGDVVGLDAHGGVCVWTVAGHLVRSALIYRDNDSGPAPLARPFPRETPLYMATDFCAQVWVVTSHTVRVLLYATLALEAAVPHGAELDDAAQCHVDFGGAAVAIAHGAAVRVVRADAGEWAVLEAALPTPVVHSALQHSLAPRSSTVAGGDGRLWAVAMADGSVAVYNVRARRALRRQCHILPFSDARAPRGVETYTKVAVDSSVVAVAVAAGWVHFYDAHLGRYLREGAAVTRRLTRHGAAPVLAVVLGPGALGVVVCGDVVQHFSYGDVAAAKRPHAPHAADTALRRARQYAIRAQMDDWDLHQHHQRQSEARADRFNGTAFESEQDELRVAMALSASYNHHENATTPETDDDAELALALEMLRQAQTPDAGAHEEWAELADLEWALEMLRPALAARDRAGVPDTFHRADSASEDEDELLRRALELLLVEH